MRMHSSLATVTTSASTCPGASTISRVTRASLWFSRPYLGFDAIIHASDSKRRMGTLLMPHVSQDLGRFTLLKRIGEGGFGVVYEAYDPRHRCRVALKVLRNERITLLQSFKREFRSLADLTHPNLARLYELAYQGETWYFAMELVDGVTFLEHAWGAAKGERIDTVSAVTGGSASVSFGPGTRPTPQRIDVARLRAATRALAEAVEALHAARKLHCDLKPSNVLVTAADRVVVLDFGLVADIDEAGTSSVRPLGTPGYMSPEQARRHAMTPATDWYSVGAMLHEVLTGAVPPPGSRRSLDPSIAPALGDLARLCADLLDPDPLRRPSGGEVLRRLGGAEVPPAVVRPRAASGSVFFGRANELARLHETWRALEEGHAGVVRIAGASGMGKTALVRRFLEEIERDNPDVLVLRGRSYEQESVPYKVFDGIMEALAGQLAQLSRAELARVAPRHPARLARLFPVFEQVPFEHAPGEGAPEAATSQGQRREAFLAVRELLSAISSVRPLVLFLDDLHWGDVDSARLLAELVRPPLAPRMLVVATVRADGASPALAVALEEAIVPVEHRTVLLGELPPEEARAMASQLLGREREELVDPVAREGGGHPIFIQQLAERALDHPGDLDPAFSLSRVIMGRVRGLDPSVRDLLEALAVAGQPVSESVAAQAAGLDGAAALQAASTARSARMLVTKSTEGTLELAHDRVREAIAMATSPARTQTAHGRLAEALVAHGQTQPEELVRHYEGAGDVARTTECAEASALRAENAYAFDRAAHYHAVVLRYAPESEPGRWRRLRRWAEALANAGRGGEAGDAFPEAARALGAREPGHAEVITLSR
ncbi:MAG TPA: AAA family ATPase, partial [Labilithrix sp.]|nr:AAA family ATPase [Labilithrix sp.]